MLMRIREERGVAMITAMLVVFVVMLLATVVVAQSVHDSQQSARDRKLLQSGNSAEAGLDWMFNYLRKTRATSLICGTPKLQTLGTAPDVAGFTVTAIYYGTSGNVMKTGSPIATESTPPNCNFSSNPGAYPVAALVTSTGVSNTNKAPRIMQSYVKLTPILGGFEQAVLANTSMNITNNFTDYGYQGNDGDIVVAHGDLTLNSSAIVKGNLYAHDGNISIIKNASITGSVWAYQSVLANNGAVINGDVQSSTSTVTVSNPAVVNGSATAKTGPITVATQITGTKTVTNVNGPAPPTVDFPQITYNSTDWTNPPAAPPGEPAPTVYTVQTFNNCTDAATYIQAGAWTSATVVRITAVCDLNFSNNVTINLPYNLAIITDGSITLSQHTTWQAAASATQDVSLFMINPWIAGQSPQTCTGTTRDINVGNQTNFDLVSPVVQVFLYTPCTMTLAQQNNFYGQAMGGNTNIGNHYTMTYRPVKIPGYGTVLGFKEDVAYIREVAS